MTNKLDIDKLLDKYNDYLSIYYLIKDEAYKQKADAIMMLLNGAFGEQRPKYYIPKEITRWI